MKNEFVPYKLALRMKQLGFAEPCFGGFYDTSDLLLQRTDFQSDIEGYCLAPLSQQSFRWFRKKYNLFGYSYPNDYQTYGYRIVEVKSPENKELIYDWGTNNTNEEAELACLEKLIEIVEKSKL